jgi:hypothetical protein
MTHCAPRFRRHARGARKCNAGAQAGLCTELRIDDAGDMVVAPPLVDARVDLLALRLRERWRGEHADGEAHAGSGQRSTELARRGRHTDRRPSASIVTVSRSPSR